MSYLSRIETSPADTGAIDAFGRVRVSVPTTLFNGKLIHDAMPQLWDDQQISGTATSTYNTDQASVTLHVNAATAGRRVRQTYQHFNYQMVLMTFVLGDGESGILKRVGYGDNDNGLFLEDENGAIQFNRRTNTSGSPVENTVARALWNVDKMDGTGPSGVTLDFTKTQILQIDLEWLGAGRVRFGFVVDGKIYYAHEMNHANNVDLVYMSVPNNHLRYEIINNGSGGASDLVCICSTVMSEGSGTESIGVPRGVHSSTTLQNLQLNNIYALIGVRLKSTHHHAGLEFIQASWISDNLSQQLYRTFVLLNPTVASEPVFSAVSDSPVEYYQGAIGNTCTGGYTIFAGISNGQQVLQIDSSSSVRFGSSIAGTHDRLIVAVQPLTNNMEVYAALNWRELG
jgi:hypothetical protein